MGGLRLDTCTPIFSLQLSFVHKQETHCHPVSRVRRSMLQGTAEGVRLCGVDIILTGTFEAGGRTSCSSFTSFRVAPHPTIIKQQVLNQRPTDHSTCAVETGSRNFRPHMPDMRPVMLQVSAKHAPTHWLRGPHRQRWHCLRPAGTDASWYLQLPLQGCIILK